VGETPEAPLIVAQADLTMIDVDCDDWFRSMKVAHTNGTARVDYARLSSLAGAPLTYAGEGRVEIIVKTTVFGREYEVVLKGLPRLNVKEQTMSLSDAEISVAGVDLPDFTGQALLATRLEPISLKGIPLDLTVTKISAVADGILLELAGDDLRIST
jgi:hypothetical protein